MRHLGSPKGVHGGMSWGSVQSAEQAAFRFAASLLVLDDVVASTATQEEPRLYAYHQSLLGMVGDDELLIDLEDVVGCQNWVVMQIGEIAVLDAWKQRGKKEGDLDVMELVYRGARIKEVLEERLVILVNEHVKPMKETMGLLDIFGDGYGTQSTTATVQSIIVTRVWAHAAFLYLHVVVCGWQPSDVETRYHVSQTIDLISNLSPPALARTVVWPFCVAGCFAEVSQESHFRQIVQGLQPSALFGSVHSAFKIMEEVWRNRDSGDSADRDLAACFRGLGEMALLV
ncbi:hypothetical protein ONS96_009460 [Cadophora gregata f. sp. sojae]|nr:hypothetical protein ONS96_009460 [Cadophora gregata f. sp. sojae]